MRISETSPTQLRWYLRPFFWHQRRKYGQVLKPALAWARVPGLFLALAAFHGVLNRRRSPLPPALRSLVMARIAQINHCEFCIDFNAATLARRQGSPQRIEALAAWRDDPRFDAIERAALEYAEAMTYPDRGVSDAVAAELRRHFTEDAVVELTALIALQNLSSKFNSALAVPAQGFCRLPNDALEHKHSVRP